MIFEAYIFESHSLGLFMRVFGVCVAVFLPATESVVYKHFLSIAQ